MPTDEEIVLAMARLYSCWLRFQDPSFLLVVCGSGLIVTQSCARPAADRRVKSDALDATVVRAEQSDQSGRVPRSANSFLDGGEHVSRAEPCALGDAGMVGVCCAVRGGLTYAPARSRECDEDRCRAAGGRCGWAGFSCPLACIAAARDEGRACRDDKECESACVATTDASAGQAVEGRCYAWALAFECLNHVRSGRATGTLCVE
jgi:hypothetical protein